MDTQLTLYGYVMACLRSKRIPQRQVAQGSGVPFSTVAKIAQETVKEPSVHTMQKLYDYFVRNDTGSPLGEKGVGSPLQEEGETVIDPAEKPQGMGREV